MAHTLLEQEFDISASTTPAEDIHNLFVQQFGYTQSGDYYFSPVDTNFGVRWYVEGSYIYCAVTFDGGATEAQFIKQGISNTASTLPKVYYHVSKNEKVIYLRILCKNSSSSDYHSVDAIIAHDDKNKTVCFRGYFSGSNSSSYYGVYMLDRKKVTIMIDYVYHNYLKHNPDIPNAIFKYPSLNNYCLCSELYGVVNVQTFDSLSDTFVNFDGQIYRIVSCYDTYCSSSAVYIPCFAFPVSD